MPETVSTITHRSDSHRCEIVGWTEPTDKINQMRGRRLELQATCCTVTVDVDADGINLDVVHAEDCQMLVDVDVVTDLLLDAVGMVPAIPITDCGHPISPEEWAKYVREHRRP